MEKLSQRLGLTPRDLLFVVDIPIACLIAYWIVTAGLAGRVDAASDTLGGMWAAVAAAFVFRDTRQNSVTAGLQRLLATFVSFGLCLAYLLVLPSSAVGMAILLAAGAAIMVLLNRREDIITTSITTIVVMVVAEMSPRNAAIQPGLRLLDTVAGIAVGVGGMWLGALLLGRRSTAATKISK